MADELGRLAIDEPKTSQRRQLDAVHTSVSYYIASRGWLQDGREAWSLPHPFPSFGAGTRPIGYLSKQKKCEIGLA